MISKNIPLREVYVWELPVRIFHWVNAFAIVGLCITGYIIGDPPAIMHATPPEANYWFGWVRLAHFILAYVFIINFLVRIYWAFAGNTFARWYNYIPLTKKQWRGIGETIKVDVLLLSPKPIYDIGHNSLAATTYFGVFLLFIIQAVTGLAMFCASSEVFYAPFFEKILMWGYGFFPMRHIHHIVMWGFILFSIAHIYLVFYHDYIERTGIASSIIGGWKFIRNDVVEEYEENVADSKIVKRLKTMEKKLEKVDEASNKENKTA